MCVAYVLCLYGCCKIILRKETTENVRLGRRNIICLMVTFLLIFSGNVVGQRPYTPGPPCTKCASGQGWCYKNLCSEYTRQIRVNKKEKSICIYIERGRTNNVWLPQNSGKGKVYMWSYKLAFSVDLESNLGFTWVMAFHKKGWKCTFRVNNWLFIVDLKSKLGFIYVVHFTRD